MASAPAAKGRVMRLFRTIHAWLGVFIFPWVIVIGATGFYLNHSRALEPALSGPGYKESRFDEWRVTEPVTEASARAVAESVWPDEPIDKVAEKDYHGRPSFEFTKASGLIVVTRPTGHYFVKTGLRRRTYAPDGQLLHSKIYWGSLFKGLHRRGWIGGGLGTWLADITSLAMIVFGMTGAVIWWTTRSRRLARSAGEIFRRRAS